MFFIKTVFKAVQLFAGRLNLVKCPNHIIVKAVGESPSVYDVAISW